MAEAPSRDRRTIPGASPAAWPRAGSPAGSRRGSAAGSPLSAALPHRGPAPRRTQHLVTRLVRTIEKCAIEARAQPPLAAWARPGPLQIMPQHASRVLLAARPSQKPGETVFCITKRRRPVSRRSRTRGSPIVRRGEHPLARQRRVWYYGRALRKWRRFRYLHTTSHPGTCATHRGSSGEPFEAGQGVSNHPSASPLLSVSR